MSKTALITGASGLLGREVLKAFRDQGWKTVGTALTRANPPSILKANLCDEAEIERLLDDVKPQVIVHCAALRSPDQVDANPSHAHAVNVTATQTLASAASRLRALLLYISTDYVFPGRPGEAPYAASAPPSPPNLYGQTKLDGERAVLSATGAGTGVVLRVPVLYGHATSPSESAVNVLLETLMKAQERGAKEVQMDDWSVRYPTCTEDVGRVCADVAAVYLSHSDKEKEERELPRVLQFSAEERFTKYEMCAVFAEIMGVGMGSVVANNQGNEPQARVQRPYDCHLSTQELQGVGVSVMAVDFRAWWRREVGAYRK